VDGKANVFHIQAEPGWEIKYLPLSSVAGGWKNLYVVCPGVGWVGTQMPSIPRERKTGHSLFAIRTRIVYDIFRLASDHFQALIFL
jgi:hypothetical protein